MTKVSKKEIENIIKENAPKAFLNDEDAYEYLRSMLIDDYETIIEEERNDDSESEGEGQYLKSLLNGFFSIYYSDYDNDDYGSEYSNMLKIMSDLLLTEMKSFDDDDDVGVKNDDKDYAIQKIEISNQLKISDDFSGEEIEVNNDLLSMQSEEKKVESTVKKKKQPKSAGRRKQRKNKKQERNEGTNSSTGQSSGIIDKTISNEEAKEMNIKSFKDMEELDDYSSAWSECQKEGKLWGGRGFGGRGIRTINTPQNIHLSNVTMQFAGHELLQSTTIQITQGNKYGLIGRNGVGKSTLLRRIYHKSIPGFPFNVRIAYVEQQVEGDERTPLQTLLDADTGRKSLFEAKERLENRMDEIVASSMSGEATEELTNLSNELSDVLNEIDLLDDEDKLEKKAIDILKGLQFTKAMMHQSTNTLSGGWKMRLALAQALHTPSDLILLDEPTNHLDLHAVLWLSQHLSKSSLTLIIASHDKSFLDDCCTHIINFEHQKLKYHAGNYSSYQKAREEKSSREAQIIDASERQRTKAMKFIEKQQSLANKKKHDPNKLRQAKMMKEKKLDRIGNYREDGKRYKNFSLKTLDESSLQLSQKVVIEEEEPIFKFKFPNPAPISSGSLMQMEDFSFTYEKNHDPDKKSFLLNHITLDIQNTSKIAIVGRNGVGKSTLLKLLTGDIKQPTSGTITRHAKLRIGHVTQHHVEALDAYASYTVVQYMEHSLKTNVILSDVASTTTGIRSHLGAFGLGGNRYAHRALGSLSGGEKMRLCFATIMTYKPHLLVLDEPTNHLDIETLDALASALNLFTGAVLIVSHNQSFLTGFCNELWIVDEGNVHVKFSDEYHSFEENFSNFRSGAIQDRSSARSAKADLVKRAALQRSGAKQKGGFIG